MSNSIEKTAKTVQEAINLAVEELMVSADCVDIEILEEGNKGFFGLIGGKRAKVKVSIKKNKEASSVRTFLEDIISKMNVIAEVELNEDEENIFVNIKGEEVGILIGRRGETLDSIQYLTSLVANRKSDKHKRVVLDIECYRQKREEALERLADKLATRVIKFKKSITLEPMTPYERRIIHASLQNNTYVDTYSVGEEPYRKIIIKLK